MKDSRWLPILAAALGVLGGIGGAFIGGSLANAGAEKRLEKERAAQVQDIRIDVYGTYLGTADELATAWLEGDQEEIADGIKKLFVAEAKVSVIAEDQDAFETAAQQINQILTNEGLTQEGLPQYQLAYKAFLDFARDEIEQTSG